MNKFKQILAWWIIVISALIATWIIFFGLVFIFNWFMPFDQARNTVAKTLAVFAIYYIMLHVISKWWTTRNKK